MFFIKLFFFIKCIGFIIFILAIGVIMVWMGIVLVAALILKLIMFINKKATPLM